jgi:FkbM family methyltransferase
LKVLRPDAHIFCFEPSPDQAARIMRNARENNAPVDVLCIGLGEKAGIDDMHIVCSGNPGMSTFHPWEKARYDLVLKCPIASGDELIGAGVVPAPDVIKLDIEGGEAAAVKGLVKTLAAGKASVVFEGGSEISNSFTAIGYSPPLPLTRNEQTRHALNNYLAARWN